MAAASDTVVTERRPALQSDYFGAGSVVVPGCRIDHNERPDIFAASTENQLTTSQRPGALPEPALRELCVEAGFRTVQRVPMENPFNALYKVRP